MTTADDSIFKKLDLVCNTIIPDDINKKFTPDLYISIEKKLWENIILMLTITHQVQINTKL